MYLQTTRAMLLTICLMSLPSAAPAQMIDDFVDGGVVFNSSGEYYGSEGPSAALGGWRAFYYSNTHGSGSMTIDESAGTMTLASNGLGQTSIGYGWRLAPSNNALIANTTNAMNADFSNYSGIRFRINENDVGRLRLQVSLTTVIPNSSRASATGMITVHTPGASVFDLPFSSIPPSYNGGAVLSDVDFMLVTVWNGYVGHTVSLDAIELIPNVPVLGDIDGDGDVDEADQLLFIGVLLGENEDPDHVSRSDLNGDESADAGDIQLMVSSLLGQ